jgi:drug/metabolite transporter (DMT)-like permease
LNDVAASRGAVWRLLAGACLISTSAVFVKLAQVPPTVSAFWRVAFGALILLPMVALAAWRRPPRAGQALLFSAAALFFALDLWFWHRSILYVGPGLSTLLANFQVFVLAAIGALFLRERVGVRFGFALLLALGGLWLLVGMDWAAFSPRYRTGVWLGLATAAVYAGYLLSLRRAQRGHEAQPAEVALFWISVGCTLALGVPLAMEGTSLAIPDRATLGALIALGGIAQVGGGLLIIRAIPHLPASVTGLLLLLQPSLAYVWDVLLFGQVVDLADAIGIGLSLSGIFLGSTQRAESTLWTARSGLT